MFFNVGSWLISSLQIFNCFLLSFYYIFLGRLEKVLCSVFLLLKNHSFQEMRIYLNMFLYTNADGDLDRQKAAPQV